jgi:Helix-turn-helix domain
MSRTFLSNSGARTMLRHRSDFVGTAQAARTLRLKKHTLDNMRCLGHGPPYYKFCGRVFYHRNDLKRWLAQARRRTSWARKKR